MYEVDGIMETSPLPLAGNAADDTSVSMSITTEEGEDDDDSIGVLWQRGLEERTERVEQTVLVEQVANHLAQQQARHDRMKYSAMFTVVAIGITLNGPLGAVALGFAAWRFAGPISRRRCSAWCPHQTFART